MPQPGDPFYNSCSTFREVGANFVGTSQAEGVVVGDKSENIVQVLARFPRKLAFRKPLPRSEHVTVI